MGVRSNHFRTTINTPSKGSCRCSLIVMLPSAVLLVSTSTLFISWVAIQKNDLGRSKITHLVKSRKKSPLVHRKPRIRAGNSSMNEQGVKSKITDETKTDVIVKRSRRNAHRTVGSPREGALPNSNIYRPSQRGKRLLTYGRFGGRLNNQLFQFITALQHAKVLKRTLVVPNEVREMDWTGMFDIGFGIWDLENLNDNYDIDWTTGLSADFASSIPEDCVMAPVEGRQMLNGGPNLWKEWDKKCPDVIDLGGKTGLLFCKQQHQFCGDSKAKMEAYKIYSYIKLSRSLIQHIPSKREEFKNRGYDELAVHARRAGEGGYDWEMCVKGNTRTCRDHIDKLDQDKFCDERTMKGNCAAWLDLSYQIKAKTVLKSDEKDYRFVLSSDGTHDWTIDFENQFVVASNTEWLNDLDEKVRQDSDPLKLLETMTVSAYAHSQLRRKKDLSTMREKLDGLTATLLDLFSLVDSKYFLGAYYSTLSLNACYLRGLDRKYDSNMCWMLMHPDSEHAILPPSQETVNLKTPNQNDHLPAALMSDVEHAFVRSDDKKFVAIDRYAIPYDGKKTVIGVLGDGLVPITIERNINGGESVRADFTCSYGDIHDSPATVILMKGNQSFIEHYYERGEKYKTEFSSNGDRFRTMIILCEELIFDKSRSRHPPLVLKSPDEKFVLTIGSAFQHPTKVAKKAADKKKKSTVGQQRKLVHCLNPVYGLKDPRWIIEYLEYHRAIGVDHVHVYNVDMHSPEIQQALQIFRDENFITRHDWSSKASGDYTTKMTYEHAKWAAQTDCALRSRGIFDYALFSDIDEVAVGPNFSSEGTYPNGHLAPVFDICDEAKKKRGKIACSFNSNTVTSIYTKLNDEEEMVMKEKLILERYDRIEAKPHCPSNCKCVRDNCKVVERKFHMGRQKYIANVGDLTIPPRPMWTHSLARDYDEMGKIMEVLPDEVMHVRHYQGHWYVHKDILDSIDEIEAPLLQSLMDTVRASISSSKDGSRSKVFTKKIIYDNAKKAATLPGVEWIIPVERPEQYHRKILV